ncbi:hypothetical protein SAMN04490204_3321 [Pseudomonas thivervalensis]|nr:hypothetical protein SAMN04490204_3321 [Pseudomonas thivervalensis]
MRPLSAIKVRLQATRHPLVHHTDETFGAPHSQ